MARGGNQVSSRFRPRRRWIVLGWAVLIGVVGLNAVAYRHAHTMMQFTRGGVRTGKPEELSGLQKIVVLCSGIRVPRPESGASLGDLSPAGRAVRIQVSDRILLGAWHCPSGLGRTMVVLFHGYGGEKTGMRTEAEAFLRLGLSVLLVDFRGSGESSESYTTVGIDEAEDVAAVMRHVRAEWPGTRVILYGQSMGGAAILRAVDRLGVRPDAVVVEAVFDRMLNTVGHRFEAMGLPSFPGAGLLVFWGGVQGGFDGFGHNPVEYASGVDCPILVLHGTADPRARVEEGRRVYDAARGPRWFKEFPGLGHGAAVGRFPGEWKEAIEGFLDACGVEVVPGR